MNLKGLKFKGKQVWSYLISVLTISLTSVSTFASVPDFKSQASQTQSTNVDGAFTKLADTGWIIVGGIGLIAVAVLVGIGILRALSVASSKDGRTRSEALGNVGWVIIGAVLVGVIAVGVSIAMGIGKGLFN